MTNPGVESIQLMANQVQTDATQAAQAPSGAVGVGVDPAKVEFSSLGQLQQTYPDFYKEFMMSWATQVCQKAKDDNDRLLEMIRKEQQDNAG